MELVENPDEIEQIKIDKRTLPSGEYTHVGFENRQVFNVELSVHVTEYQGEILKDQNRVQWVANFPLGVNNPTQYGSSVKAHSVYMSQFQLIPQLRVAHYFNDQLGLPLSKRSVQGFNELAYDKLEEFEDWAKHRLLTSELNHADETSVNVNGQRFWFHLLSNTKVVLYQVDTRRGTDAMDRMGVLPEYKGILCHDHWKPYYRYSCTHSLCNAHHLRELERAWEQDDQKWAKQLKSLLIEINQEVKDSQKQCLSPEKVESYQQKYRDTLSEGEKECPPVISKKKKRGRTKQSKSRNLLVRLGSFEQDTLRFMQEPIVPFSNNLAENDLRMTKVQQKISGCFRSLKGAKVFCRGRSYLLTCQKNGVKPKEALAMLFEGKLPEFMAKMSQPP